MLRLITFWLYIWLWTCFSRYGTCQPWTTPGVAAVWKLTTTEHRYNVEPHRLQNLLHVVWEFEWLWPRKGTSLFSAVVSNCSGLWLSQNNRDTSKVNAWVHWLLSRAQSWTAFSRRSCWIIYLIVDLAVAGLHVSTSFVFKSFSQMGVVFRPNWSFCRGIMVKYGMANQAWCGPSLFSLHWGEKRLLWVSLLSGLPTCHIYLRGHRLMGTPFFLS